jgi:peroxiredoxin
VRCSHQAKSPKSAHLEEEATVQDGVEETADDGGADTARAKTTSDHIAGRERYAQIVQEGVVEAPEIERRTE